MKLTVPYGLYDDICTINLMFEPPFVNIGRDTVNQILKLDVQSCIYKSPPTMPTFLANLPGYDGETKENG